MEWLTSIRKAIDYMEEHLEDNISAQDVAGQVFMSSFFFQKGFSLMTGYGLSEYIRNRRLYKDTWGQTPLTVIRYSLFSGSKQ